MATALSSGYVTHDLQYQISKRVDGTYSQFNISRGMPMNRSMIQWRQWCAAMTVVLAMAGFTAAAQQATGSGTPLDIKADHYDFKPETGDASGQGNVQITYQDITLTADNLAGNIKAKTVTTRGNVILKRQDLAMTADELSVNFETREIAARGNIVLTRGDFSWRGQEVSGNVGTKEFKFGEYRAVAGVMYMKGTLGQQFSDGHVEMRGVQLSTCEYFDHPHYSLRTNRMLHFPNGDFRAYNVIYMVGGVPLFYFPVVFGNTEKDKGGSVELRPGYSGNWGAYLLTARKWQINDQLDTKLRLDLRSKSGVAVGNETNFRTATSQTSAMVYGMYDMDPPETTPGYDRRFATEDTRYRAKVYHRQSFDEDKDVNLRLRIDKLSDIDMLENWFKKEYRTDPQPRTFGNVTWDTERFSLGLNLRARVNDFFTEAEELPKLSLVMPRQTLGDTGFLYQSQSSVGQMEMKFRKFDQPRYDTLGAVLADPADYKALRMDTLHMFYRPLQLGDNLQLLPRAGFRLTYYDTTSKNPVTVADLNDIRTVDDPDTPNDPQTNIKIKNNYDDAGGSVLRLAGETGFELSSKFYQTDNSYKNARWDIDGLRHVLQPYVNYTYTPEPSEDRDNLYFFDEIDRLIEQNFVRVGLRQRWQTRRSNQIYTFAAIENYADFHFVKEEGFDNLGNFGTKFFIEPRENLRFWGNMLVDMGEPDLNRGELGVGFGDPKVARWDFSYLYRNAYDSRTVYSMGSSLTDVAGDSVFAQNFDRNHYITGEVNFPIDKKTAGRIRYEFDIEAGRMARQLYEITRDLHCWMGSLRVESEEDSWGLMLALYLKAFPSFGVNSSL